MSDAILRTRCACGWESVGPEAVVVAATLDHARSIHNMEGTREGVLERAEDLARPTRPVPPPDGAWDPRAVLLPVAQCGDVRPGHRSRGAARGRRGRGVLRRRRAGGRRARAGAWVRHGPRDDRARGGRLPRHRAGPLLGMLADAERKRDGLPPEVRRRVPSVQGDMTDLQLGETFDAVVIPFRSFMFMADVDAQRRSLGRVSGSISDRRRAGDGPVRSAPGPVRAWRVRAPKRPGIDPGTGHTIRVDVLDRTNDPFAQVLHETWRFTESDVAGAVLRTEEEVLSLRWTYRHEMHHLLELAWFEVVGEFSDFDRSPPAYGDEQVWLARRP